MADYSLTGGGSLGFSAPSDWGTPGFSTIDSPSYIPSYDLGTGLLPTGSEYSPGFTYDAQAFAPNAWDYIPLDASYQSYLPEPLWYDDLYKNLGGARGIASLSLGGLSLLSNWLANKDAREQAEKQFAQTLGFKEKELERTSATDLAKVDAIMNLLGQRQGVQLDPRRYAEIVSSGQIPVDMLATQGAVDVNPENYAAGGAHYGSRGPLRAPGLLRGGSPGQADDVNARLSHGEYVFDADVVSALGDGNTEAGARRLDEMREAIRRHKRSAPAGSIPPAAKDPMKYLSMKGK